MARPTRSQPHGETFVDDPAEWRGWTGLAARRSRPQALPGAQGGQGLAAPANIVPYDAGYARAMKRLQVKGPPVWAQAVALVAMFLFSEFLISLLLMGPEGEGGSDSSIGRMLFYPAYAAIAVLIVLERRRFIRAMIAAPVLVAVTGLVFLSVQWSIDPGVTLRRAVALGMTTAFGLYLGATYSWMQLIRLLALLNAALLALSLVVIFAAPELGRDFVVHDGAWRGGWQEKNTMGAYMARALIVFLCAAAIDTPRRWLWLGLSAASLFMAVMSNSATSLIACTVVLATLAVTSLMQRGAGLVVMVGWAGLFALMSLGVALAVAPEAFVAIIGKDLTLTGRTDIWEAVSYQLTSRDAWGLGFGFGAFWSVEEGPAYWIRQELQWDVPNAHNGWLETILGLGLVGAVLMAIQLAITLFMGAAQITKPGMGVKFALAFLMLFLLYSLSESFLITQNNIVWVLFAAVTVKLMRPVYDARRPPVGRRPRFLSLR